MARDEIIAALKENYEKEHLMNSLELEHEGLETRLSLLKDENQTLCAKVSLYITHETYCLWYVFSI